MILLTVNLLLKNINKCAKSHEKENMPSKYLLGNKSNKNLVDITNKNKIDNNKMQIKTSKSKDKMFGVAN